MPYLARLQVLPLVEAVRERAGEWIITTASGKHALRPEAVPSLSQAVVDRLVDRLAGGREPTILIASHVPAALGQRLGDAGINFIDLAGNCHLRLGDAVAWVEGRRRVDRLPAKTRGLGAAGYQALFALLAEEEAVRWPIRRIAAAAGVSRQAVVTILDRLVAEGLVARSKRSRLWVEHRRGAAIDRWVHGYLDLVRPASLVGRFRTPDADPSLLEARIAPLLGDRDGWRWGGSVAAHRWLASYRGPSTVVHVVDPDATLARRLKALPAQDGPLLIFRAFGPSALLGASPDTAHPLLVYAELLASGSEREREVASQVRVRFLGGQ